LGGTPDATLVFAGRRLLGVAAALGAERGRELVARVDPELAVGAREVELDRLHGHEERLGDVLVAAAARRELGDPALAGRQGVEAREDDLARPRTRRGELLVPPLDEPRGP
jgi:hypothetical protein